MGPTPAEDKRLRRPEHTRSKDLLSHIKITVMHTRTEVRKDSAIVRKPDVSDLYKWFHFIALIKH